jgi:hypothetical protein
MVSFGICLIWGIHSYFFADQQPLISYGEAITDDDFNDRVVVLFEESVAGEIEDSLYLINVVKAYQDQKINKIVVSGQKKKSGENRILAIMDYFIVRGVPEADLYPDFYSPDPYHTCRRLHEVFSISRVLFVADHFRGQQALFACQYLGKIDVKAWVWPAEKNSESLFSTFKSELSVLADVHLSEPSIYLEDRPVNIFAKLYPY